EFVVRLPLFSGYRFAIGQLVLFRARLLALFAADAQRGVVQKCLAHGVLPRNCSPSWPAATCSHGRLKGGGKEGSRAQARPKINHPSSAGSKLGWAVPVSAAVRGVRRGPGKGAGPRCRSSSRFAVDCFTGRPHVIPATSP